MTNNFAKTHKIKILPPYYDRIISGQKTFEIRNNDRDYQVGDWVNLREWDYVLDRETGRGLMIHITYVTTFCQQDGYVVFGFSTERK